jgi:Holliday junction resolvase
MMVKRLEKDVQRGIVEYLRLTGWNVYRGNNAGTYNKKTGGYYFHGTPGVSDLIAVHPVKHVVAFIECKRPGGKASIEQKNFLALVHGGSCIGFVAQSIDDVKKEMEND